MVSRFTSSSALLRCVAAGALSGWALAAAAAGSVYLDELTSPELAHRVAAGTTTVLVPIGGTEQNGPHMVLGKHNVRAHVLAGRIAEAAGDAVVAPVLAYVPEGSVSPPAAHMRFAGTISIPEAAFEATLEGIARSMKQHGLRYVFFLGDHGGYQKSEERVAARLNKEWAADPRCRVYALAEYYEAAQAPFSAELRKRGYSEAEIGTHAGVADTSLALAADKSLVRDDLLGRPAGREQGVYGDARRSTAALGETGLKHIVEASVAAIKARRR